MADFKPQFVKEVPGHGTFTFRLPTLRDDLKIEAIAQKMLAEIADPPLYHVNIAQMMAALQVCIVEAPDGFDLAKVYQYEQLEALYNAYFEQVCQFRGFTEADGGSDGRSDQGAVGSP